MWIFFAHVKEKRSVFLWICYKFQQNEGRRLFYGKTSHYTLDKPLHCPLFNLILKHSMRLYSGFIGFFLIVAHVIVLTELFLMSFIFLFVQHFVVAVAVFCIYSSSCWWWWWWGCPSCGDELNTWLCSLLCLIVRSSVLSKTFCSVPPVLGTFLFILREFVCTFFFCKRHLSHIVGLLANNNMVTLT